MNERIHKLFLDQEPNPIGYIGNWGRVMWVENVYPQVGDELYARVDLNKFAELIVRECAKVYWNIDNGEAHAEYVAALKKHFGIGL